MRSSAIGNGLTVISLLLRPACPIASLLVPMGAGPSATPGTDEAHAAGRPDRTPLLRPSRTASRFRLLPRLRAQTAPLLVPLALLLAGLVFAAPAAADVLISNIGKSSNGNVPLSSFDSAQGFTTGASSDGYTLESVEVVAIARLGSDVRVRVRSGTPGGSTIATLTNPWSLAAGTLTFSAPTGITLAASTTYYVVLDNTVHGSVGKTSHTTEDSGGAAGGSIENDHYVSPGTDTWTSYQHSLRIRVNGVAKDLTAPTLDTATVDGATLTLNYNEALDTGSTPATTDFTVSVAGTSRTLSNVEVSGSAVTLTLSSAVTSTQTVTVSYTAGTNPIQDLGGNDVAALSSRSVTNNTPADTTVPTFSSATVNGTSLVVTFSEAMNTAGNPASSVFRVTATPSGGSARTIDGTTADPVTIDDHEVTVTLASAVAAGETVTVAYRGIALGAGNKVRDLADNNLADFSGGTVTNNTPAPDTTAPTVAGGTVELIRDWKWASEDGARLKLYFSEELDPSHMPLKSDFTLFRAVIGLAHLEDPHGFTYSQSETFSALEVVQVDGNTLELNVGKGYGGMVGNDVFWIRIDDTSRIRDLSGNTAAASAERIEIVNLLGVGFYAKSPGAPRLAANAPLVVDGATLTVRFDQPLIPFTTVTGTGGFSVSGAAQPTAVTHVDTTATTVVLTLDREVGGSETGIELSYDAGTTAIRNFHEQRAAGFNNRAVANAGAADTVKPALVAGASTIAGTDVRLRFSEEMSASNPTPTGSQFVLNTGDGGTDLGSVTLVSISGSVVRLSTANAALATDAVNLTITDTSNIRDLAGNEMDAVSEFSLTNSGGSAPGKPGLASDTAAVLLGNVLTLTFDQALDRANVPPASAFTVSGTFPKVIVDAVAIDGAHVRLTLHQAIAGGTKGLAVSYDESAGKRLRNLWREAADGFEGQPVRAAGTDTVAPAVVRGEVRGDELKLYFDEPLDETSEPAGSVLGLWARDFWHRWIPGTGRADVAGNVVTVTLKEAVKQGERLEVWYLVKGYGGYQPIEHPLQDAAGNRLGADCHAAMGCFNAWDVDNIDTHPPKMMTGTVKGSAVTLHFSEPLDRSVTPAASQFTFIGPSVGAVGDVAVDGVRITMTTEKELAAAGETINVIIADTANIRDRAGNQAEAVADAFALTNLRDADPGAPVLVTRDETAAVYPAKVSGDTLALTFDKTLDTSSVPAWSGPEDAPFRLGPAGWLPAVASVIGIEGETVILRLDSPVQPCDGEYLDGPIAVDYVQPAGGPLQNLWGTDVAAFSGQAVENLGADRCTKVSAEMSVQGESGRSVAVGFHRALDTRDAPEAAAFTVASAAASGEAIAVEGAAFSEAATGVVLSLSRAVAAGEALTVSYRRPEGGKGLWDTGGNEIAPFSVTNAVSGVPALSVSDARAVEGEAVEFTVSLSAASDEEATVDYATSDGTAKSGTDFTAASGTLTFAAGATTQTVRVETAGDSTAEADETFALTLSNPSGATLSNASATGTIEDGPAVLTASFEDLPEAHDGAKRFAFEIRFSEEFRGLTLPALKRALAVTGGRLIDAKRTVPGQNRSVTVRVRPSQSGALTLALAAPSDCAAADAICASDGRRLSAAVSAAVPGPHTPAALPVLSVADARADEGGPLAFAVTLSAAGAGDVTVDYATADGSAAAGADYTAVTGTLTFAAGETAKTVSVAVLHDGLAEDDETVALTLSNASGAAIGDGEATGTVADVVPLTASLHGLPAEHDGRKLFAFEIRFSEEFEGLKLTAFKAGALQVTEGRVVGAKRTVPGQNRSVTVRVRPSSFEDVSISLPATADCSAPVAICAKDGRKLSKAVSATVRGPVAVSVADAEAQEGADPALEFAVTLSRSASGTVTVDYATRDGTAKAGEDYTRARHAQLRGGRAGEDGERAAPRRRARRGPGDVHVEADGRAGCRDR